MPREPSAGCYLIGPESPSQHVMKLGSKSQIQSQHFALNHQIHGLVTPPPFAPASCLYQFYKGPSRLFSPLIVSKVLTGIQKWDYWLHSMPR